MKTNSQNILMFLEKTWKQALLVFQISKYDLITTHLTNLNANRESIRTDTEIKRMKPIVISTFYCTPRDSQVTQTEGLDISLYKLGNKINTCNVIITEDFNLPNINRESHLVTPNSGYSRLQLLPTNYSLS